MSSPELITLIDMGFEKKRAERALEVTGYQGVEPAMEWLLAHVDEQLPPFEESIISREPEQIEEQVIPQQAAHQHVTEDYSVPMDIDPVDYSEGENIGDNEKTDVTQAESAKSLKCDECGKLFSSEVDVQMHAVKSGHSKFSESAEEKKPLNEEEKREQLKKLEEKMKAKRVEREEKEKKDALEREKMRIRSGKEMVAAKKKLEEQEMKKLVEQRKREKLEEKMARQRVKEQIEQDKLARRAKFGMGPSSESLQTVFAPQTSDEKPRSNTSLTKDYSQTKLQIRLTNGQALTQTFGSKEQLSAVRLYVEMNRTDGDGPFSLMTNFPKKVFTDDDYEKPLDILGLVPSAVVIVSRATKNY